MTVGGGILGLLETCLKESGGGWPFFDPAPSSGENGDVCNGSKTLPCEGNRPCLSSGGSPVLNMWPRKRKNIFVSKNFHVLFMRKVIIISQRCTFSPKQVNICLMIRLFTKKNESALGAVIQERTHCIEHTARNRSNSHL